MSAAMKYDPDNDAWDSEEMEIHPSADVDKAMVLTICILLTCLGLAAAGIYGILSLFCWAVGLVLP